MFNKINLENRFVKMQGKHKKSSILTTNSFKMQKIKISDKYCKRRVLMNIQKRIEKGKKLKKLMTIKNPRDLGVVPKN
jgi:hypothetical protein